MLQLVPMRRELLFPFSALVSALMPLAAAASISACQTDDSAAVPSIPGAVPLPALADAGVVDSGSAADATDAALDGSADASDASNASDAADAADVSVPADG